VVHTIPPVRSDSVRLQPGRHNIIPISTPRGDLKIQFDSDQASKRDIQCLIRRKGSHETVNLQMLGQTEKYITGTYNLEVFSLPRLIIEDVKITDDYTTTVLIPSPGIAVIQKNNRGYGSLYLEKDGKLEWIYNLREEITTIESLILLPGSYRVVFRSKHSERVIYTIEKSFEIKSGVTTNVKIF
jgi:Ca-activated chloride channel family protein